MSLWISFFVASCLSILILFVPGYLILSGGFKRNSGILLSWSPLVSIFLLTCLGLFTSKLNVSLPGLIFIGILLLISVIGSFLSSKIVLKNRLVNFCEFDSSFKLHFIYLFIAVLVGIYAFLSALPSLDSFSLSIDNVYHINEIHSLATTGLYSPTSVSVFPTVSGYGNSLQNFYPAEWHVICALLVNISGFSIPVIENAVNFVFGCVIYPLGCCSLLMILTDSRAIKLSGSVIFVIAYAFPWRLLTFGLLCSNFASFALVLTEISLITFFFKKSNNSITLIVGFLLTLTGLFDLLFLQPNGVFSVAVIIFPFFLCFSFNYFNNIGNWKKGWLSVVIISLIFCLLWLVAYKAPFSQSTLSVNWNHYTSKSQYFINCLLQSFSPDSPANVFLSILVLFGLFKLWKTSDNRWIVFSYLVAIVIHCSTATSESVFKHWLSGFWYTDPYRTAVLCTLVSLPIASFGFCSIFEILKRHFNSLGSVLRQEFFKNRILNSLILLVSVFIIFFYPSYTVPGSFNVETVFGKTRYLVQSSYDLNNKDDLNWEEIEFCSSIKSIVGNSLVINDPFDGSSYLYGLCDIQTYYRSMLNSPDDDPNESISSKTIRHSLVNYSSNKKVRSAVRSSKAKYVLLLDYDNCSSRHHVFTYSAKDWSGINDIDDSTPGFSLIKKKGHCRLYRID